MAFDDDSTLAGWHRDPSGRHELRFWNGDRWTEHVIDDGIPGLDAPTRSGRAPAAAVASPPPPPPESPVEPAADEPVDRVADDRFVAEAESGVPTAAAAGSAGPVIDLEAEAEAEADLAVQPSPMAASVTGGRSAGTEPQASRLEREADDRPAGPGAAPSPARARERQPEARAETSAAVHAPIETDPEPAPEPTPEPTHENPTTIEAEPEPDLNDEPEPGARTAPIVSRAARSAIISPTVASPAGNSAGSNTSAIADPHGPPSGAGSRGATNSPRVAGVEPAPIKRYRPGSPPPSPFARAVALPAAASVGTMVVPWYRKPLAWVALLAVGAGVAVGVVIATNDRGGGTSSARLGGRPPGAAPVGSKVIDGDGFGIAAPATWITTANPGRTFPQLRQTNWGSPRAAIDAGGREAMLVVPLEDLAHSPQVDPDLFWSDQVVEPNTRYLIKAGPPFGVHGYRANRVTVTDLSGAAMEVASIDTGDRIYLVAFTGPDADSAITRFQRFIQTFDVR